MDKMSGGGRFKCDQENLYLDAGEMICCFRESGLQVARVKVWGKDGLLKTDIPKTHTNIETCHFKQDVICHFCFILQNY